MVYCHALFSVEYLWKSSQFKISLTCTNNVQVNLVLEIDSLGWHIFMPFFLLNSCGNLANSN
jgi:hypothetical protein